jgi:hypothetical protein
MYRRLVPAMVTNSSAPVRVINRRFVPARVTNRRFVPARVTNRRSVPVRVTNRRFVPVRVTNRRFVPARVTKGPLEVDRDASKISVASSIKSLIDKRRAKRHGLRAVIPPRVFRPEVE